MTGPEAPVRVLVVDDEPDLRILLWLAVEADGRCSVVADASNGRDGIAMAAEHQPDVIVLDHLMPDMDGIRTLPLLREAAPRAKVIMLSALTSEPHRIDAIRAGADAYLEKGASFRPLLDLAVNLAHGHHLSAG